MNRLTPGQIGQKVKAQFETYKAEQKAASLSKTQQLTNMLRDVNKALDSAENGDLSNELLIKQVRAARLKIEGDMQ